MGIFDQVKIKYEKFKKLRKKKIRDLQTTSCIKYSEQGEPVNLTTIIKNINNLKANTETHKSRTSLVYNFGECTDLNIGFSYVKQNRMYLSKGISRVVGTKSITVADWNSLVTVSINSDLEAKFISNTIVLDIGQQTKFYSILKTILHELEKWSIQNYPLITGIDIFESMEISSIELFSLIMELVSLKLVFYYRRNNYLKFLNIKDNYPTEFFSGDTKLECYLNSMIELKNLLWSYDSNNAKIYRYYLQKIYEKRLLTSASYLEEIKKMGMNIFDNNKGKYFWSTTNFYRMGFCLEESGKYVPYIKNLNQFQTKERYILVTTQTQLMLNGELIARLKNINIGQAEMPEIDWIDGVPGCGKTTYILENHVPGKDLVLTQTRAAISEIRTKIKLEGKLPVNSLNTDYRTVSSFIINNTDKKYERVFIDEAVLMHAGYTGFIASLSGAKHIILLGDSRQIPYIERSTLKTKWYNINSFCQPNLSHHLTKRCPIDVCHILANHYPIIHTTNNTVRSILPMKTSNQFHQLEPNTLILTYTQAEKSMLINTLKVKTLSPIKIHTIHEAQGFTSKNVVLIRINSKPLEIYNSVPHTIVALSRHTNSFIYIKNGGIDLMETIIQKIQSCSESSIIERNNQLNEYYKNHYNVEPT